MTDTDKPLTQDLAALNENLVRLAMEACAPLLYTRGADEYLAKVLRERMAQVAQAIVLEVEELRDDVLMGQDALGHCRAALEGRETQLAEVTEAAKAVLSGPSGDYEEATWTEDHRFFLTPRQHAERALRNAISSVPKDLKTRHEVALQVAGAVWAMAAPERQVDSTALSSLVERVLHEG